MDASEPNEVREALDELDQYLADEVPPLLVADSVRLLMARPARILAEHLLSWTAVRGGSTPDELADALSKAVLRIYQVVNLQLVPRPQMRTFLGELGPVLLAMCPVDARFKVRTVIEQLLSGRADDSPPQQTTDSLLGGGDGQSQGLEQGPFSDALAHRLVPLLEKLARTLVQDAKATGPVGGQEVVSQLLAAVTRTAETAQQLEERLERLKAIGLDTEVPAMLRALGQSLPNWALVAPPSPSAVSSKAGEERAGQLEPALEYSDTRLRAMQRIVELGKAPEESAERFDYMLQTAVEQFNQGALGRAVSILESANQLVVQERIQPGRVKPLWDKAAGKIQWRRFEMTVLDPVQHQLLGQFLSFFPTFSPLNLLTELKLNPERTGRRLLISLLQVRGDEVRPEVWAHLGVLVELEDREWDYTRDLVNVLASLPLKEGAAPEEEMKLMTRLAALPLPLSVFREAVRFAARIKVEQATGLLTALLTQASLGDPLEIEEKSTPGSHWTLLFEQILSKLAGSSDTRTRRLVLDHCLERGESAGISTAPLAVMGTMDLASEPDVVTRLLAVVDRYLPSRWLSWIRRPNEALLLDLVRALSGTSSPRVQNMLSQISRRFPHRSFGVEAARAIRPTTEPERRIAVTSDTRLAVPPGTEPGEEAASALGPDILLLEGELHSFKLPTLIQHLESAAATGILELLNAAELVEGTATFVRGQLFHCHAGHLRGKDALFALLEKPVFGRFRVVSAPDPEPGPESAEGEPLPALPVVPTLLEGMRRYDEYQQLRLLVPDHTILMPTGELPGRPEGEDDAEFVWQVWAEAVSGKAAAECEAVIRVDPYRVRRLLAYWTAEGSLVEVPAASVKVRQGEKQPAE